MTRIAYVSGRYVPQDQASTRIEDRGYVFADGAYEYIAFYGGKFLDLDAHLARLEGSLDRLRIPQPMTRAALKMVIEELRQRNYRTDGAVYLQVTRGVARRDHPFPRHTVKPVVSMTVCAPKTPKAAEIEKGVAVIIYPDERWKHCNIKSVALLANVLAKQACAEANAKEAWLYLPDEKVTEGAASNAFIVKGGEVITHKADHHILPGITRDAVLRLARENGIKVQERAFTLDEAYAADEAFLTSTSPNVLPVVSVGCKKIGDGKPGPVTRRLMELYYAHIAQQTGRNFA